MQRQFKKWDKLYIIWFKAWRICQLSTEVYHICLDETFDRKTINSAENWEREWTEVNCNSGPCQPTSGAGTRLGRRRNRVGNCIYGKCQPPPNFIISRNKIQFWTAKALDRNVKIRFWRLAGPFFCFCDLMKSMWMCFINAILDKTHFSKLVVAIKWNFTDSTHIQHLIKQPSFTI